MELMRTILAASLAVMLTPVVAQGQARAQPEPAAASGDPVRDDFICFIALSIVGRDAPEDVRSSFDIVTMYFTGKLFGRDPELNVAEVIENYTDVLEGINEEAEVLRCLEEFHQMGIKLNALDED